MKKSLLAALLVSVSAATGAYGYTITFSEGAFPGSGTTLFAGTSAEVLIKHSGPPTGVFAGDTTGVAVFPNDPTAPFFSVSAVGWATFEYANVQSVLSFDWGTQDNYNKLTLSLGGVDVTTITGVGNGTTASPFSTDAYKFDKITFFNNPGINSFEFDNVHVPDNGATLALLGLSLCGIAIVRRKTAV